MNDGISFDLDILSLSLVSMFIFIPSKIHDYCPMIVN